MAGGIQGAQQLADIVVQETDHAVIGGAGNGAGFRGEKLVVDLTLRQCLDPGMAGIAGAGLPFWQRNAVPVVHFIKFRRRNQWEMRADEGHEQDPGLVTVFRRFFGQPGLGLTQDVAVVLQVC